MARAPALANGSNSQANLDGDGRQWLEPYLARAENANGIGDELPEQLPELPQDFVAWWDARVRRPLDRRRSELSVGVDSLVCGAVEYSPYIQAVSVEPGIRRTTLVEEHAEFDWKAYLESSFDDKNDPIGNTLTTGNNDSRFKDQIWSGSGGLRRKTSTGGTLDVGQRLGDQRNNSRFLLPNPQATSRLELSYSQPLLNGAGSAYNQSRILLASIDGDAAQDKVAEELQEHLLKVTQTYWELYRARAVYLQRMRMLQEAESILENLMGRQQVDALERQILRARSAVANRRSEIARATTTIRNAESQLRMLVNDPVLIQSSSLEFVPFDTPLTRSVPIAVPDALNTALLNRPDISQAIRNLRSTTVRLGVAKQDVLPQLDLVVSTYVAGLEGDSRVFSAFGNQFADGRPGYSVGLLFKVPLGNRAANARLERRQLEMIRATSMFRNTVEQALTETEQAIREAITTHREMVGKFESMVAAGNETNYLIDRWQTLPGLDDSATLLLEDLLDSQTRLVDEESTFVTAQVSYSLSLVRLRRSMGTLLRIDHFSGNEPATHLESKENATERPFAGQEWASRPNPRGHR